MWEPGPWIERAWVEDLRAIVKAWAAEHREFAEYVRGVLCPPIEVVDFAERLRISRERETREFFSCHEVRVATDWSRVYFNLVLPWSEAAGRLSDGRLYDLIAAIVREVGVKITEVDFEGCDWYGDDFSQYIADIMDVVGNLTGLLLIREDLSDELLDRLEGLVLEARECDVAGSYMGSPYGLMLSLIGVRREAEEVSCGVFDAMIEQNFGYEAGMWVCRKIDFIRSMGLEDEARGYMLEQIAYQEVSLKYYEELMAAGLLDEAVDFLDVAIEMDSRRGYSPHRHPDWRGMKRQLLAGHPPEGDGAVRGVG